MLDAKNKSDYVSVFINSPVIYFGIILLILSFGMFGALPAAFSETTDELPPQSSTDIYETEKKQFIGYRHKGVAHGKKLPNGAKDLGGGLLSDEDYGVTRFAVGDKFMLWLERIIERDADGVPIWEVKDVLVFDKLKKNQQFFFSYSSPCADDGEANLDVIVFAEAEPKRQTYNILKAWRANVETEKFEAASAEKIVCE